MKTLLTYRSRPGRGLRIRVVTACALSGLVSALAMAPARADEVADVSALIRASQYGEAMAKADAFLGKRPRDAQMRFLKGVILAEQNRQPEAIAVFSRLTEEFPELPEPYNNLAVLYAGAGQYEKARAALDKAIHTNPAYATAYENLGDVHARLASQAYDKALQLDSGNAGAKSKLTLVRSLVSDPAAQNNTRIAAAPAQPKAPAAAPTTPPASAAPAPAPAKPQVAAVQPAPAAPAAPAVVAKAEPKPEPRPAPAPAAAAKSEPKPAPAVVAKADPKPEPRHEAKPAANAERDAVLAAVNGWARAWSAKDVKGYLAYYANEFATPGGISRKAWADERQARIAGKGRISVRIEAPQVALDGNVATVKFRQGYISDRLSTTSRKTLVLNRQHGKWLIQQERTGG